MKINSILAGILSLFVPGLGQIYCGKRDKGAAILAMAIIIGNLNILFVPIFLAADLASQVSWGYWIPRIGHDVISVWSLAFWIWAVFDAYFTAK